MNKPNIQYVMSSEFVFQLAYIFPQVMSEKQMNQRTND